MSARALYLYTILHFLRTFTVVPFLPLFVSRATTGESTVIGVVIAAFSLGPMLLAIPSGALIGQIGGRWMLHGAAAGDLVSALILLGVDALPGLAIPLLLVSQTVAGLAHLVVIVGGQHFLSNARQTDSTTTKLFGRLTMFMALGQLMGPLLGGLVLKYTSYPVLFGLVAAVCLPMFGAVERLRFRPVREPTRVSRSFQDAWQLLKGRSALWIAVVIACLMVFSSGVRNSFYPLYLERNGGLSEFWIGVVIAMFPVGMTGARYLLDRTVRWLGRPRVLLGSLLAAGGCMLMISTQTALVPLLVLTGGVGWAHGYTQPSTMLEVKDATGEGERGVAFGLRFAGVKLASTLSPLVYAGVVEGLQLRAIFWVAAGAVLFAGSLLAVQRGSALGGSSRSGGG